MTIVDARLVYFPFLVMVAIIAIVSYIGSRAKQNHKGLTNFVVMLGMIEHIALITQVALAFIFSDYAFSMATLAVWFFFLCQQFFFHVFWQYRVVRKDHRLK